MNYIRPIRKSIRYCITRLTIPSVSADRYSLFVTRSTPAGQAQRAYFQHPMASAAAKRLDGKTILITGASSGIGWCTAKEFARTSPQSLKLIVTARRVDKLRQLADEIKGEVGDGVKVLPAKLDVTSLEEVKNFVPSLPAEFQDINVLVNNA
jgi:3-hydroxy acid dehydrogenase / malonic semialdehyde reductase